MLRVLKGLPLPGSRFQGFGFRVLFFDFSVFLVSGFWGPNPSAPAGRILDPHPKPYTFRVPYCAHLVYTVSLKGSKGRIFGVIANL